MDVALAARTRPISSSRDQLLPVLPPLAPLLPGGGLTRGTVVAVGTEGGGAGRRAGGDTSLAFALLAAVSTGSWCGAVGPIHPGVVALAELGVDLTHLVFTPRPGPLWPQVTATLLDGMDVVLLRPPGPVGPVAARRLAARTRERRAVLVVLAPPRGWPEGVDLRLAVQAGAWEGVGPGHGYLQGRRVQVVATGRRAAARTTTAEVWLPDPSGRVVTVEGGGRDGGGRGPGTDDTGGGTGGSTGERGTGEKGERSTGDAGRSRSRSRCRTEERG